MTEVHFRTLPGLLAIAKDIAAAQQLDVYGRRLAWHRALEGLDQLLKQLPVLGERAERWNALLVAWQATVLRAIEALQAGAEGARVPNPYLAGNPLQLAQKALFKGRRDLRDAVVNFEKVGEALRSQRLTRQVLDELRHTIQHRSQMALLFAGVQSLDELGPDWSSYFINVRALTMGYLSRVEAEDLIRRPDPGIPFGLEYTAGAVERIAQSTLGHPYLVQLVCSAIVEAANERGVRQADEQLVAAGEALALERGEPYFRNLWDEAAGAAGQPLLRRIAAAARAVSIRADSAAAQQALERMQRHGVIVRRKPGLALLRAHDPYQVEVPLVRRWIRERAPA